MICARFGANHHCHSVLFGCVFLLNEKTDKFMWYIKAFFEFMGNQCQAMANAISMFFRGTCHPFMHMAHIYECTTNDVKLVCNP